MTSCLSRISGQTSTKTLNSSNTFLINIQLERAHHASISLIYSTLFILNILSRSWSMLMSSAWLLTQLMPKPIQSKSLSSGKRNWNQCHTYPVSKTISKINIRLFPHFRKKWKNTPSSQARIKEDIFREEEEKDWSPWLHWWLQEIEVQGDGHPIVQAWCGESVATNNSSDWFLEASWSTSNQPAFHAAILEIWFIEGYWNEKEMKQGRVNLSIII